MGKNVKAMNGAIEAALALLSQKTGITEQDPGEFAAMKAKGIMKFKVRQFELEGIGNLSVMTMDMGLMQMSSLVFAPFKKDLALMSLDYMYILGKRKAYLELYDLVLDKSSEYLKGLKSFEESFEKYNDLQNTTVSPAWYQDLLTTVAYKMGKSKDDQRLMSLLLDTVKVYLDRAAVAETLSPEQEQQKKAIIEKYSHRLIDEGGVSTDFFKKSFGADFTRRFFDKVFFGTGSERYTH